MTMTADRPTIRIPTAAELKALAKALQAKGMTHQQIADEIHVSKRTWRAWLYGERSPSKTAAQLIDLKLRPLLAKKRK
jgi:orotate phosphoribosyltransferase-like protein